MSNDIIVMCSSGDITDIRRARALLGGGCPGPMGPIGPTGPSMDIPVTTSIYVDFLRTDSYTESGSIIHPFKTLGAAYTLATASATPTNPKILVLQSGNTLATAENITFTMGHIYLTGDNSSGTHAPIVFYGSLTFTASTDTTLEINRFSISFLAITGVEDVNCITFSGTNAQMLLMKDVWVIVNGAAHGITMTNNNTGTGSLAHIHDCKFTHNGSGAYHCIDIQAGTAKIDTLETIGVNVGVIGIDGGACNIMNANISSGGSYVIDVYAGGTLTLANSTLTSIISGAIGINLIDNATAFVLNVNFVIPSNGKAISTETTGGGYTSVLWYGPMFFLPGTSAIVDPNIGTITQIATYP
jgi:hypothetical protein